MGGRNASEYSIAKRAEQREIIWASITSFGAEINIICIPILLSNFRNPNTKLFKLYGSDPLNLGIAVFLLIVCAAGSLWAMYMVRTNPDEQAFFGYLASHAKEEERQRLIRGFGLLLRKAIYFMISFTLGILWLDSLIKLR